jgi:chromosomal replication initiation ATPase DnaA
VSGAALLLSGEAGVGKTVLLDAAEAHAQAVGSRVITLRHRYAKTLA